MGFSRRFALLATLCLATAAMTPAAAIPSVSRNGWK
jgi:hypothetical protein